MLYILHVYWLVVNRMLLQRSDAVQSSERLPLYLVHGFICCYTSIIPEFDRLVCCSAHN